MLGTFSPQQQPYTFEMEEETTPSGMFARGSYYARTKVINVDPRKTQFQHYREKEICIDFWLCCFCLSLWMMMANAIWTRVTASKFRRAGQNPFDLLSGISLALAWKCFKQSL